MGASPHQPITQALRRYLRISGVRMLGLRKVPGSQAASIRPLSGGIVLLCKRRLAWPSSACVFSTLAGKK